MPKHLTIDQLLSLAVRTLNHLPAKVQKGDPYIPTSLRFQGYANYEMNEIRNILPYISSEDNIPEENESIRYLASNLVRHVRTSRWAAGIGGITGDRY